jgi:DNA-directed RNA polymerase specialized sigma24 family protein
LYRVINQRGTMSKPQRSDLTEDVEALLEKVILEEATHVVWQTFEKALEKLDPESRKVLEEYFNGEPVENLCQSRGLSSTQLESWLSKVKRDVSDSLKKEFPVKQ